MPSLTRVEAVERAALLTVRKYRITLDLTGDGPDFGSDTTIEFSAAEPGASTFLDLRAVEVRSVTLNDEPLDPAGLVDGRLPLTGLRAENVLRVQARMAYSSDGEGMHRHVDPADGRTYLYAMSFLDAAPRWFGCFDQPDLKAPFDIEVHCPPEWTVIGNGAATRSAPGHWRLASTRPLATYFVTVVAGPYASITAEHDGIALGLHARASLAPHLRAEAADILGVTTAALDRFHELFGIRYPFGEYHQAFVPDFNAGAMENPGCVTLRDQYIFRSAATRGQRCDRASTITHEMAHMWFGDLVTMRWWDDLWLNESFAEYMGYRVCADLAGEQGGLAALAWLEFGLHRKDWGRVADQSPSNHPVAGNGSSDAAGALSDFDGISYAKGASALKQLAAHFGDEVFFAGLRRHFERHQFGNAEFADLMAAWTEAGALDLDSWAQRWLRTSGLDTLTGEQRPASITAPAGATVAAREVWLSRISPDTARRPHTIRVTGYDAQARPRLDEQVTLDSDAVRVGPPDVEPLRLVVADSADDSWAKIRFGSAGWQPVAELLPRIAAAPTRVVLYNAIRDAVRNAELDPAQALDMVLAALAEEPVELVTAELLQFATDELAGNYARPADRPGRRAQVAALTHRLLAGAEAGSDAQLEAARAGIRQRRRRLAARLVGRRAAAGRAGDRRRAEVGAGHPAGCPGRALGSRHRRRAGPGRERRRGAARGPGPGDAAGPGRQAGDLGAAHRAQPAPGLRAVRQRRGFLRARPDGADRRLPAPVLHRDAGHRHAPAGLGAGPGGLQRVPGGRRLTAGPGTGRGGPGRRPGAGSGGPAGLRRPHRHAAPGGAVAAALWRGLRPAGETRQLGSAHE
ncbi:MAG TPA: aminopeptidase N [Jatrophihabitans sp.]